MKRKPEFSRPKFDLGVEYSWTDWGLGVGFEFLPKAIWYRFEVRILCLALVFEIRRDPIW